VTAVKLIVAICCAALIPDVARSGSKSRDQDENRRIMFDYAECVVRQRHDRAADAILSNADNEVIQRRYGDLIRGDCLVSAAGGGGVQMKFGGDLYRYALADALVNADFFKSTDADFTDRPPLAHIAMPVQTKFDAYLAGVKSKRKREEAQAAYTNQVSMAWLSRFGECVVRQEPAKARAWLLTPINVAEETSRINDLRSAFSECLGQGTLKFNRVTMRGTVALNYYRLARATAQSNAGKVS
jgi:hypothetical protein